jgi:hypothetical protein
MAHISQAQLRINFNSMNKRGDTEISVALFFGVCLIVLMTSSTSSSYLKSEKMAHQYANNSITVDSLASMYTEDLSKRLCGSYSYVISGYSNPVNSWSSFSSALSSSVISSINTDFSSTSTLLNTLDAGGNTSDIKTTIANLNNVSYVMTITNANGSTGNSYLFTENGSVSTKTALQNIKIILTLSGDGYTTTATIKITQFSVSLSTNGSTVTAIPTGHLVSSKG